MRRNERVIQRLSIQHHVSTMQSASRRTRIGRLHLLAVGLLFCNCALLRGGSGLQHIDFALDSIGDVRLAGVPIAGKTYSALSLEEATQINVAVSRRHVPLSFVAHVGAENPSSSTVTGRLIAMSWTAYIEDKPIVSGEIDRHYDLPPGQRVDVPLQVDLDLYDSFAKPAEELFKVAQAIEGSVDAKTFSMRAKPTIQSPDGAIEYPEGLLSQ